MRTSILFICHGNICRSVMAQCVLQDMVNKAGCAGDFFIDSAAVSAEELGNPPHWGVREVLRREGIPLLPHRARRITAQDYGRFDLLIGMDRANLSGMLRVFSGDPEGKCSLLLSCAGKDAPISDPYYSGDFDGTYRDVLLGCRALLEQLRP